MTAKYNVLWVDDQHNNKEMVQFVIEAENAGINLEGYSSFEEAFAMLELEDNINRFDCILLDGMFFEKKGQVAGTEDEAGIGMAIAKINELKYRNVLPWFVLSGKESFTNGNPILAANKKRCFDKTNRNDISELFTRIKDESDLQENTRLRHEHYKVFELCDEKYIGTASATILLSVVKMEKSFNISETKEAFTSLRKIIELLFQKLNYLGVIPDEIFETSGWFNPSSRFLCRTHKVFKINEGVIHPTTMHLLEHISKIVQDASHIVSDKLPLKTNEFITQNQTSYLFKSTLYQLFDVLIWFKVFIDNNQDIEKNKLLRTVILEQENAQQEKWVKGTISTINEKDYGTFKSDDKSHKVSIPPHLIQEYQLTLNDTLEVTLMPNADGTKMHINKIKKTNTPL